ncbi:unnamed protein product [Candida verbasci]|uniref:Nucleolar complex-associated protein 3 n=1 Tax=Candida verbasci TaxID=1227364 RepID=A0A9W4U2V5_9ASCO|nr:unnamed protein product [Candida verbasci]
MGKRKLDNKVLEKKKQIQQEKDAELLSGVFNNNEQQLSDVDVENWDNEEMEYELQPRQLKKQKKLVEALPIKTSDGTLQRVIREEVDIPEEEPQDEEDEEGEDQIIQEDQQDEEDQYSNLSPREKLTKLKEEIAELASKLIEDPEENISCLTRLRKMSESKNFMTSQLAIMSLAPIFKSLAPSYKIRPLTDVEKREKVSKEVARLRNFEQNLVFNYKCYIELLSKYSKTSYSNSENNMKNITSDQLKRGNIAIKAANELCNSSSLKHFNFRDDLFLIISKRLNKKPTNQEDLKVFQQSIRIFEILLNEDSEHGDITFDLIKVLCKTIKDKKYRVDESVINILLSTKLLQDYDPNNNKQEDKPKLKKKDRVHLSKKERKARKEIKEIEEEMRKAQQSITIEQREKYQAQVLKMILTLYLEILKAGSSSENNANANNLVGSVLEGLSKFGQMSNLDLLGDFLTVLKEIMIDIIDDHNLEGGLYENKQFRTILLCIATSFSLILNHQSVGKLPFNIDLKQFISILYQILTELSLDADIEFNHKSLRLIDPDSDEKPSVNVSIKSELLLRCLDFIFFKSKNGSNMRAASFIKRLYITLLDTPEKTSLTLLKFIGKLINRYDGLKGLWNTEDRISGEGNYILGIESNMIDKQIEIERSNFGAATLWENVLLDKHYCPMVKDGARSLMKNSKSNK